MRPLIAVDVGNSRIKLGLFRQTVAAGLPEPQTTLYLTGRLPEFDQLDAWLNDLAPTGAPPWRSVWTGFVAFTERHGGRSLRS